MYYYQMDLSKHAPTYMDS